MDMVNIDMDYFVKKFQPDCYDQWKASQGPHLKDDEVQAEDVSEALPVIRKPPSKTMIQ